MSEDSGSYPTGTKQINVTLSPQVLRDFKALAAYQDIGLASLLRQRIEADWANPGTQKLIERAKSHGDQKLL